MKAPAACTYFAPGRGLPHGECENCHWQRHEHKPEHTPRSGAHPPMPVPDAPVFHVEQPPPVKYCRMCGAGIVIHPPHDPDRYQCPKCGHVGPKSLTPIQGDEAPAEPEPPAKSEPIDAEFQMVDHVPVDEKHEYPPDPVTIEQVAQQFDAGEARAVYTVTDEGESNA